MKKKTLQIVEDDLNGEGQKDLTRMGPLGPIVTLYGVKGIIGYFLGATVSLIAAGLTVGAVVL